MTIEYYLMTEQSVEYLKDKQLELLEYYNMKLSTDYINCNYVEL